jgi:predicted dehydrogenase
MSPCNEMLGIEPGGMLSELDATMGTIKSSELPVEYPPTYLEFLEILVDALDQKIPAVAPQEAANVIRIIELALESSMEGKTVPVSAYWGERREKGSSVDPVYPVWVWLESLSID